jgi:hypothetical protein
MSGFEKNRNSLTQALQQLPAYTPPADVWDNIASKLYAPAQADETPLAEAVRQLPTYVPPADVWGNIVNQLDAPAQADETPLVEAVRQLPAHTPPPSVWNTLTRHLDEERGATIRRMRTRRQWMAAAATVALVVSTAWWVFREPPPKISIQYAQETMQQFQMDIDWDEDTGIFDHLDQQLASINNPTVNKLKVEYEELTLARKDVESMLKSYGQDPQLIRKMADIERERTDIYRQLIAMI